MAHVERAFAFTGFLPFSNTQIKDNRTSSHSGRALALSPHTLALKSFLTSPTKMCPNTWRVLVAQQQDVAADGVPASYRRCHAHLSLVEA